jgi:hypothetical protein
LGLTLPADADVIDGVGMSLVPGPLGLAPARSTATLRPIPARAEDHFRPLSGSENRMTVDHVFRCAAGQVLLPHVYLSRLLDGQGPKAAPLRTAVCSLDAALAVIRKAKIDGFNGLKIYGTIHTRVRNIVSRGVNSFDGL